MDYFRGVHETLFEESPWSPQVHVDSTGTPHGLSMESMWTIGNAECSPPKIHGVCGNVWGSVKYSSNCIQTHFPKRLKIKEENIYICPTAYAIIPNHR